MGGVIIINVSHLGVPCSSLPFLPSPPPLSSCPFIACHKAFLQQPMVDAEVNIALQLSEGCLYLCKNIGNRKETIDKQTYFLLLMLVV